MLLVYVIIINFFTNYFIYNKCLEKIIIKDYLYYINIYYFIKIIVIIVMVNIIIIHFYCELIKPIIYIEIIFKLTNF